MDARARSPRWLRTYYFLAALTALTVGGTLFMAVRVMNLYDSAVDVDHDWDVRRAEFDSLSAMAFQVDEPVLRVMGETNPRRETEAIDSAYRAFESAVARIRSEYRVGPANVELRGDLDSVDSAIRRMTSEADQLIGAWVAGRRAEVKKDDSLLEVDFARANVMLARARSDISRIQEQDFAEHRAGALRMHRNVQFLGLTAILMLIGLALFGKRLSTAASETALEQQQNFEAIQESEGRYRALAGELEQRVETRTEQLRVARETAEAASRAKGDFLANMSHEIRTPMNGVLGMLELTMDTELTPVQRDYVKTAFSSAESLLSVINDILDFSKIEAGHLELDPTDFDLVESLSDTISTLAIRAQDKGLELTLEVDSDVPVAVHGDLGRLRQIVINLVGNAIKFTDRGEVSVRVSTEASEQPGMLHFAVRDTGVGISPEKQQLIFEAFRQADASTTRQFGGTGLGLAISTSLVSLMGGRIWVASQPGEGSVFHFTASLPEAEHRVETAEHVARAQLEGTRVLVVDDNATNRRILDTTLSQWGMKPVLANDGEEALEILTRSSERQEPFDLIITDVDMPRLDGFGLVERLRARPEGAAQTVLMLSSARHRQEVERCRMLGVEQYLTKPIRQSQLREAITAMLGRPGRTDKGANRQAKSIAPGTRSLRILVAEDNTVNQKLGRAILEGAGHTVVIAENGQAAVDLARESDFDVILMDVQMPILGGFEATQQIRDWERQVGGHVPIIAVTARAMSGDREACLAAGMDGYLAKPLRAAGVHQAIEELVPTTNTHHSSPTPNYSPGILDRGSLDDVLGTEFVDELIATFFREAPRQVAQIRDAIAGGDAKALREAAHSLKGAAGAITATRLAGAAAAIEAVARDGDTRAGAHVDTLDAMLEELRRTVNPNGGKH
jgi:signal transduction histidine kinase/CheY-like chemotaxis protein/HPt (histidine-containing phosphotransfer) domain-containing protein